MGFNLKEQYIIGILVTALLLLGGLTVYNSTQGKNPLPIAQEEQSKKSSYSSVVVHVSGEVNKPGVYHLKSGQRVIDAIEKAGGATGQGDLDKINLAALLEDGQKVLVPSRQVVTQADQRSKKQAFPSSIKTSPALVNINTADEKELDSLPGIGPALAERIIQYREEHGTFTAVEDLEKVSGIGEKKFLKLKELVTVN